MVLDGRPSFRLMFAGAGTFHSAWDRQRTVTGVCLYRSPGDLSVVHMDDSGFNKCTVLASTSAIMVDMVDRETSF